MVEYVFIVPYRDRETHKHFFDRHMKYILEDYDPRTYDIIFSHQNNNLPFNRGAMKNIGFLYAKEKYANYKEINFIFNDVDTLPYRKGLLDYNVKQNEIKHYYGFTFALGGIFSIKGADFEKIDGFPNLWSWGYEDNIMQERALAQKITLNRNHFYPMFHPNILHILDEYSKKLSLKNKSLYENNKVLDGLSTLKNINYRFNNETNMLDITAFECLYDSNDSSLISHLNLPSMVKKHPFKTLKFI
jgi:hypothetical protein